MANDLSSENLRMAYVAALKTLAPSREIWLLFLGDDWFQAELDRHAEFVVKGDSSISADDVRHEAMLLLAAKFQSARDLGLDALGLGDNFAQSIGVIVRDDCVDARRRLHRLFGTSFEPLPADGQPAAIGVSDDLALELRLAIDDLPPPMAAVLRLHQMGCDIDEIAEMLGLSYKQAYGAHQRGLKLLSDDFA